MMRFPNLEWDYPEEIIERARLIKVIATDVDGVLTQGDIIWQANGIETKQFNVKDGYGLRSIRKSGIKTAIITARESAIVAHRAQELDFDYVHQAAPNKKACLQAILDELQLGPEAVAYMGDDLPDLGVLQWVGLPTCPADAMYVVRKHCAWISHYNGGAGAMRELTDLIAAAQQQGNGAQ
jgi:3-deoxy-D-manno-octulosonate 8-phosphate phosphatase (KDO 8-P phosphatase)